MKKHAYLIMAHNEPQLLIKLIKELDDPRNDIYLHVDKKSKEIDINQVKNAVIHSGLYIVPRMRIYWGTISQVKCELRLLRIASKSHYHYYHLISGMDFPLKTQDYIHDYLEDENGLFLSCHKNGEEGYEFLNKVRLYYPLLRFVGKGVFEGNAFSDKLGRKLGYWQLRLTEIQKEHNIDRIKKNGDVEFYKGDQWFSITHDFVMFVLRNESRILKTFFLTDGADEIFLPTLAMNSGFAGRVRYNCLRKIDWQRGSPYEFRICDLEELKSSEGFFARKLSYEREAELVEKLTDYLHSC